MAEYGYLMERQMMHVPKHGVPITHDSLGTRSVREFVPIVHRGRSVYVDVKTGTLYDATTGECLSSGQMRLVLDAPVQAVKRRKDLSAQSFDGWLNDTRRTAA